LQAGDQVVLPAEGSTGFWRNAGVILGAATSISLLIFRLR
jgi:hypothetical protein